MATPKSKPEPIDYLTLLGYITKLGIKVYNLKQVDWNFSEFLGSGSSMTVYRGDLIENSKSPNSARTAVAVKVPNVRVKDMERDAKAFKVLSDVRQELRMMKHFESHPYIINLYGVVFQDLKPLLIVELAEDSITEYLKSTSVDWETKARFCCEVADGLQALHTAKIVHGDLKGDNILLFSDHEYKLVAKITDFGYSATEATIDRGGKTGGSLCFLAPECTMYAPKNMKDYENKPFKDNYAFGLYVWQVAKDGEIPYDGMDPDEIHDIKNSDTDLNELMKDLEEDTPQCFRDVIVAMTKYAPEEREELTKVREMMKVDDMNTISYSMVKNNLELYAKELPRDITKADLSSIEFMSIPPPLKIKIYRDYEKAAGNGDANAMFMLAICYSIGFGVEIDKKKTLEWCSKAAEAGSSDAIFNITRNYNIREIPVEASVAFPWYLKAAEEGRYEPAWQISDCYRDGYGVIKDRSNAIKWKLEAFSYVVKNTGDAGNINETVDISKAVIGETSLYRAARLGNVEDVRFLLEHENIDISANNNDGFTALHIAAQCGHIEIVKLLTTSFKIDTNAKTKYNETLLTLAASRGHVKVVRLFANVASITTLDLSSKKMGNSEAYSLGKSLKMYTGLTNLLLTGNNIGDEGACTLAECLKQNSTLTSLNLKLNQIGDNGACAFAEYLKYNSTLTYLSLDANKISAEGTCALAECLKQNSTLTYLSLDHNQIGVDGACALSECLEHNSSLTNLYLHGNEISDKGACALAKCLKQNLALTYLNLNYNQIGVDGACALSECLKHNSTLTNLYLYGNQIDDDGACALAECLKHNSTLTNLDLDGNKVGDNGACAFAECLKHNSTLTKLDLDRNKISDIGACAFAECLKHNSTLAILHLYRNKIGDKGACALAECLKQNSTLTLLYLYEDLTKNRRKNSNSFNQKRISRLNLKSFINISKP